MFLVISGFLMMSFGITAQAVVATVSNAKVIELSAHRIDRLVSLSKIDASFLAKLAKMEVTVVQNQAPVAFKVMVSQTAPAQGKPMQVEISFDSAGKPLAFQVIAGGVAGPDAGWTGKDAGSLAENALHYVLENSNTAKVPLFDKSGTSLTLSKQTLNGQTVARGQVLSSATTEKLNIYLKLDGTFISAEVVP